MSRLSLQLRVSKALASAGATEEILALVNSCFEACLVPRPNGRPRQYANRNEQQRAYRERKRREKALAASSPGSEASGGNSGPSPDPAYRAWEQPRVPSLKGLLVDAARWNVDRGADVEPIRVRHARIERRLSASLSLAASRPRPAS